mgnify:CR=1 FL=1
MQPSDGAPIEEFVRCPTCEELVDPGMVLQAGRTSYLLCWNGHRFGLDGQLVVDVRRPDVLTECASSEAGAG